MSKKLMSVLGLIIAISMLLAACGPTATPGVVEVTVVVPGAEKTVIVPGAKETVIVPATTIVEVTPTPAPVTRTGGWLDSIVFTEQNSAEAAVTQLQANDIDVYAYTVADPLLFDTVKNDPNLGYTTSVGSFNEITANPVPTFADGRINPFGVAKFREAFNMLIDRSYISKEIFGGLAIPMYTTLNPNMADYARYVDVARGLEAKYAYNPEAAKTAIDAVMTEMGATLGADGKWQYNGAPVTIVGIIRTEDKRKLIGDYVSSQLETVGFTVDRQYKTRSEASPIWNSSDPNVGLWNFYTGGWIATVISRDDATNFGYYYTNRGSGSPLWQNYKPSAAFDAVCQKLWINDFKTMDERKQLFTDALNLSMEDSVRIWLVVQQSFAPQKANLQVAYDLAGGVAGSQLFGYTVRWKGEEGGTVRVAQPGELVEPWNPIAGSNWIYDQFPIRATGDNGLIADPYTGLYWPQRITKADCVVKEGLPVAKTLDWITLTTAPKIDVPADAWADWDAKTGKFIAAGDMPTPTLETNTKCTVTYPADLFTTVKWHDGSPLSIGDFVMRMIMLFDPGKADSAIYDPAYANTTTDPWLSHNRGIKIESTDPLVITTYDDIVYLDAEWLVSTWFPYYGFAQAPWHTMVLGNMAEAQGKLAYSTDKAGTNSVEWMSFIAGPSLDILKGELDTASAKGSMWFTSTLSQYITADEVKTRWANLNTWYNIKKHFWVGTGPYYLQKAFPTEKTVELRRFEAFPDLANKWSGFGQPKSPVVEVTGPAQVKIGAEAKFDVAVTFDGAPYPTAEIGLVKFLVFDATGAVAASGEATAGATDGAYTITLGTDVTGKLTAGSDKLEVIVSSLRVAIPTMFDYEFVTTQ